MAILYKLKETVAPVLHPVPRHDTLPCHFASRAAASTATASAAAVVLESMFSTKNAGGTGKRPS